MITNEHLLQAFAAAGANNGVMYVSTPITSGKRLFEVSISHKLPVNDLAVVHSDVWTQEVLIPNIEFARSVAENLRRNFPGTTVVDPTQIEVKGWQQFDYNAFWINLISRFPTTIIATPGWEFSKGARYEIAHALATAIRILDIDGEEISQSEVDQLTFKANRFLQEMGFDIHDINLLLPPLADQPVQSMTAASQTFEWLVHERQYQVRKFGTDQDDEHTAEGLGDDNWWWQQLNNYYHRAKVLGLETQVGRQALAKFTATSCGLLESVIRVYGPLPHPGVPSGEI